VGAEVISQLLPLGQLDDGQPVGSPTLSRLENRKLSINHPQQMTVARVG
jgi:hypothetical protein